MSALFGSILFLNAWVLAALAALPLLYFLLRVTPPAPKIIKFPAARFVKDLISDEQTPSSTPWWLLLLRLLVLALIIVGLAHPIASPSDTSLHKDNIRLVIDNGWSSAHNWNGQIQKGQEILSLAGREQKTIYIHTTAPEGQQNTPQSYGPLSAQEAKSILKGLAPQPWLPNYEQTSNQITQMSVDKNIEAIQTFWLSDGVRHSGDAMLKKTLKDDSDITYYRPAYNALPVVLKTPKQFDTVPRVEVWVPDNLPALTEIGVQALAKDGRVLDYQSFRTILGEPVYTLTFEISDRYRDQVSKFILNSYRGAASKIVLDDQFQRRNIGIMADTTGRDNNSLIEATTYIEKALSPYANISFGTIEQLLETDISALILSDVAGMPTKTLNALEEWVDQGGLLLRFAGPNMTQSLNEHALTPVKLRQGGRHMSGALTWDTPLKLGPFPETSPLYGLKIPSEVTVSQQILAEPTPDLEEKSWAVLEDGTPLITAAKQGDGLLVFIHTTATPDWSDLSLSGLFVDILRRTIKLAGTTQNLNIKQAAFLEPLSVMDGFGNIQEPGASVKPISAKNLDSISPGVETPPGIYGHGAVRFVMNLGNYLPAVKAAHPPSGKSQSYNDNTEIDYQPSFLSAALILFLCDWLIMFLLSGNLLRARTRRPLTSILLLLGFGLCAALHASPAARAQNSPVAQNDIPHANTLYLAYIKTGNPQIDATSQKGLDALAYALKLRTSAEPDGAVGLDPSSDTLSFFPLIYWPVSGDEQPLRASTIQKVQSYLEHGGTILFDTRDQNVSAEQMAGTRNAIALKNMISGLNIPPLIPAPDDHVLGRSFYLLDSYPGAYSGGTLWVEQKSENGRDGVSSVLIGAHDWASSWARQVNRPRLVYGKATQDEYALRFGINLMMYALTGNYKADQVHVPHILERLQR